MKREKRDERLNSWLTHCLAYNGVLDPVDATGKHSEGQCRVEAEVEEHVPSFPANADSAAGEKKNNNSTSKDIGEKNKNINK